MSSKEEYKLDNPVWNSLSENHQAFAIKDQVAEGIEEGVKFYHPDHAPFGGFLAADKAAAGIDRYGKVISNFYLVGQKPLISSGMVIKKELITDQMILREPVKLDFTVEITTLQQAHQNDLIELVNLVQPGFFRRGTTALGTYFGIYLDNQLIAAAGERMKMNAFTEISAVVTHPDHTGKGYAKQLIAKTAGKICHEGKMPYLHVAASNTNAIGLYTKLGFKFRSKISFWNINVADIRD